MKNAITRKGEKADMLQVLALINELAAYEKAPKEVLISEEILLEEGFGLDKIFDTIVAELDGEVIGMLLYYPVFSTWKGRSIYLEDFIVSKNHRRKGVGQLLIDALIFEAKVSQAKKIRWQVLDWNTPAIKFYQRINATLENSWIDCTLSFS
ncbi:MAG: GNAT family N-acetyltransferase [Flavobacteriales bacterium]|nr:GNAT family N-acetyltransferase [Flavobacteriales bacterium]